MTKAREHQGKSDRFNIGKSCLKASIPSQSHHSLLRTFFVLSWILSVPLRSLPSLFDYVSFLQSGCLFKPSPRWYLGDVDLKSLVGILKVAPLLSPVEVGSLSKLLPEKFPLPVTCSWFLLKASVKLCTGKNVPRKPLDVTALPLVGSSRWGWVG